MTEHDYLSKVNYCRKQGCPNLSYVNRMIEGKSVTHHLPVCNYKDSCNQTWIGEIDYCERFEERL